MDREEIKVSFFSNDAVPLPSGFQYDPPPPSRDNIINANMLTCQILELSRMVKSMYTVSG